MMNEHKSDICQQAITHTYDIHVTVYEETITETEKHGPIFIIGTTNYFIHYDKLLVSSSSTSSCSFTLVAKVNDGDMCKS